MATGHNITIDQTTPLLARAIHFLGLSIAKSAQFQTETGDNETDSFNDHVRFMHVTPTAGSNTEQTLPVPLCLITMDPGPIWEQPIDFLDSGELFMQLVLKDSTNGAYSPDDKWIDQAIRLANITHQAKSEFTKNDGSSPTGIKTCTFGMTQPPQQNDLRRYKFTEAGNPVQVTVHPILVLWNRTTE